MKELNFNEGGKYLVIVINSYTFWFYIYLFGVRMTWRKR
jgi:hypothetical protein